MKIDASMVASDPEISAWVAANAGSGKTYTLANRVARLLLARVSPEKILCLTFTKAAAAEMQDRLFHQLGRWAMLPDDELRKQVTAIGGEAHGDLKQARRLFAAALETPGGLKVLTLHAFCQIVLARFPIEAGIPPAFEVLDEPSARALIAQARNAVLERAGSGDAHLAAAVAHLVTEAGEQRLTQILNASLGGDRRKLDRFFAGDGELEDRIRAGYGLAPGETVMSVTDDLCRQLSREIETLKQAHGWLASGSANDLKAAQRLAPLLRQPITGDSFAGFGEFFLTEKAEPRKNLATKGLQGKRPDLIQFLESLQQRYCDVREKRNAARAADLTLAALTLVQAVRDHYYAAKRLRGVLDYDDLIEETRALLSNAEAAQWVLYKLDGGIDHVLIDEAQDTSPEQWEIVKALTADFFTGEGRERRIPRTIFAVGDEKQSIFSFQGADPRQFDLNRRYFAELAHDAGAGFRDQPLIVSRRSAPDVLAFVDEVFRGSDHGLTFSGAAITHAAHRDTAKGGIEFWPALKPDDSDDIDPWAPVDEVQRDSPVARLARQVADRIAGWLTSGAQLPGHDRPIRPQDIMILLPRRDPFGSEVIRQLKLRRVPVAGADRMRLTQQIAVMDLIALGRFVLQRDDDLNLAALLRSPLCGLSDDELFTLAHDRTADLWSALVARQSAFAPCHAFLSAMLERADYAPPYEFYAHALSRLDGRARLLRRLGAEAADVIEEFLSLALGYEAGHSPSLEGFLDWVAHGGTEIKRDMDKGRDEVRVMTVHGAKGLEADIVILPDTGSQPGGLNRQEGLIFHDGQVFFPVNKQEAPPAMRAAKAVLDADILSEHRRLLYVALTRARDRLYVCGFQGRKAMHQHAWYHLMERAAKQMGVEVTRGDGVITTIGSVDEERGTVAAAAVAEITLPDWTRLPAPPEPSAPRLMRPSDAPTFSPLGAGASRFRRGLIVHALLARLPDVAPGDRRRIALAFARGHGLPDDAAQALVAETLAVLDDPQFAAAFASGSQAEAGLLADLPELGGRIHGRIDRLAVTPDQVLILDYKTNRPAPATEADVPAVYLRQMALYRAGAAKVFPGRRIVCGLVFTDGPRLLGLSDAVLEVQLAEIRAA
jgi:ATP-dependent helicase/nuclease subunit A